MKPPRLRAEDLQSPERAADVLNRAMDALASQQRREVRTITVRIGSDVNEAFPFLLETGGMSVADVRVLKAENVTSPDSMWVSGGAVAWRKGPGTNIEIRHISGLDYLNSTYRVTLALEEL